ncbi:MAG: hypothetical protein K9H61_04125 [Bacteroidia bacterium]|nr:hypothetical protein [Bacteroidia bacterium]MCF8446163.1 hypothetical protein [Bacteroidia bacterium]
MDKKIAQFLFYLISIACLLTALFTDGLGNVGDSITHYIIAKYSWKMPILFFDHWGKPFFSLIASPFAQFGFKGIKLFNVLCAISSAWFAGQVARKLEINYWYFTPIFVLCAPLYFPVMLSGLTEPFSALVVIIGVYLWLEEKEILSISLSSLLPFVRSEGLIILLVILTYLLFKKKFKLIPWLLFGHVVYSFAGWYFHKDLLWVFTKIPYATASSVYGKGTWFHFIEQLYFCLAPILFFGLILGVFFEIKSWFKPNLKINLEQLFLVYGISVAFVLAHTIFWALGIFNSMGLNRVLVTIFPLLGIIILIGFSDLLNTLPSFFQRPLGIVLLVAILIFPFLNNPASIDFKKSTQLSEEQVFIKSAIAPYLIKKYPTQTYVSAESSFALFTNRNVYDESNWKFAGYTKESKSGEVILYDPWYFQIESGLSLSNLQNDTLIHQDTILNFTNEQGEKRTFGVFIRN